jgi:[glutamine synthetase] adenylyltransferase / [glutamine synthetase]-adenylyl-L-tyrosine phosphorylase
VEPDLAQAAPSVLARHGFEQPEASAAALARLGAWPPGASLGGRRLLADVAASAHPDLAARSLAAIAERHPDPDGFAAALRRRRGFRRRLIAVLAASRSIGAWLAAHPEEADRMVHGQAFMEPRSRSGLVGEAVAVVSRHEQAVAAWEALRRFKRRELVRVAVRDLLAAEAVGVVEQVGEELAWLAEACVQAGLVVAARGSGVLVGAPGEPAVDGEPAGPVARLVVVGMGKLGGAELNYVSDIDVMVCHEPLPGVDGQVAARAAEGVVRGLLGGLGAVTPEGSVFRVDANLRPEGRNGPLSRSLGSYVAYWDRWAQPWEFQALVKARPVAGDAGLGARWLAAAQQRVWPARLDPELIGAIRRTKARVEAERLPAGADPRLHVKLGPGGLADVEWTVQLLQLRLGRQHLAVRQQGTLAALAELEAVGALDAADAGWLRDAYRLCMRIRNAAYLVTGRPVDLLPTDLVLLERLARAMGEPAPGRQRLLEAYRRATRRARRVVMARFWEDPD